VEVSVTGEAGSTARLQAIAEHHTAILDEQRWTVVRKI